MSGRVPSIPIFKVHPLILPHLIAEMAKLPPKRVTARPSSKGIDSRVRRALEAKEQKKQRKTSTVQKRMQTRAQREQEEIQSMDTNPDAAVQLDDMITAEDVLEHLMSGGPAYMVLLKSNATGVEVNYLLPGRVVPADAKPATHPILAWSGGVVDQNRPSTWPAERTQLADVDVGRVCDAGIPTRARYERWPSTFDSNGNIRLTRQPLGPPSVMEVDGLLYIMVYKGKYKLRGDRGRGLYLLHDQAYQTTYVDNLPEELIAGDHYVGERVPSLPSALEFVQKNMSAIMDTLRTTSGTPDRPAKRTRRIVDALKATSDFPDRSAKRARPASLHSTPLSGSPVVAVRSTPRVSRSSKLVPEHVASPGTTPTSLSRTARFEERYAPRPAASAAKPSPERNNGTAAVKAFRLVGRVVGELFDKAEEMDARLAAIGEDAKIGQSSRDVDVKDRVLSAIAKFAGESQGQLAAILGNETAIRDDLKSVSNYVATEYEAAAESAYKCRGQEFYDTMTMQDDWAARLQAHDAGAAKEGPVEILSDDE